ncbi:amino acid--[acyl-carrier-protein] ligase [Ideonella paludis]|uniref:Amino acid--[acyl-carrier-protein] ligase n=1 Tax=Ideonella paludis TaxID=1233411 RepID=A0ABS5E2C0_9BURK|nr:amino acid--[acyl-carrier-protein] ligase [Ideonella paludis]MBQ0937176.1 amino acid--[acyl-carrier-protein] ligase [Ideonella paludis]
MTTPQDRYDPKAFYDGLVAHGLIIPTPIKGGYGRGAVFEDILDRFDALVQREAAGDGAETMTFPPIVARTMIEKMGYLDNFPQLIGSIHSFFGKELDARAMADKARNGERWEEALEITESMLLPAACYPVYPVFSGLLPDGGRLVTVRNWCYRHEPSDEPTRLQSFRMREYIRVGAPDDVQAWRNAWLERGLRLLQGLKLPVISDVANDPFFGKAGKMMATSQREQQLKFEIMVPVISEEKPTAICSFNWHQEHFTGKFGIQRADGSTAHTACLGFGLERVTLALIKTHGFDVNQWPADVRAQLWP